MRQSYILALTFAVLGLCVLAGLGTGVFVYRLVNPGPPASILLIAVSESSSSPPALYGAWAAIPRPDWGHVRLVGLPPETWVEVEGARLGDLYREGGDDALRHAVAGLLDEVDALDGVMAFSPESLRAIEELAGGYLVFGAAPQDAQSLRAYMAGAPGPLAAFQRQTWLVECVVSTLAGVGAERIEALLGRHAEGTLSPAGRAALWRALAGGNVRLMPIPLGRFAPIDGADPPALRLLPPG